MQNFKRGTAIYFLASILFGCNSGAQPPDLVKTQREALEKAKAVDGQIEKQAEAQRKAVEDAQK